MPSSGRRWSPASLGIGAVVMALGEPATLTARFDAALSLLDDAPPARRPGRTYQGFVKALARESERRGRTVDCLIQVNVSGESSKGGYGLAEAAEAIRRARSLPALRVTGLMTIPAPADDPESSRPAFRALRALRDAERSGPDDLRDLSMGMSGDYAVAVEEGATIVRLGTALFGGLPESAFGRSARGD